MKQKFEADVLIQRRFYTSLDDIDDKADVLICLRFSVSQKEKKNENETDILIQWHFHISLDEI